MTRPRAAAPGAVNAGLLEREAPLRLALGLAGRARRGNGGTCWSRAGPACLPGSAAAGRMDLLSVLAHEMGHALGLGHTDGGVMALAAVGAALVSAGRAASA